nr:hypothetical protein [Tanacetum cinerariifolium]
MLLAMKDKDEQVHLARDQAWMESSSDSDQEINANMVFMAQIDKVLLDSEASSSSVDDKISEVSYYLSESKSESEYETSDYYDNTNTCGLFLNDNDDQEIFHDCENFLENLIESQINHNESAIDHNDSKRIDKLIRKFNKKIAKCLKRIEKANQQNKDFENQNKDLQDKYDVLKNQATTFEMNNKELNEQLKVLIEKTDDLLAQTKVLKDQLQVKNIVIDTHVECQEKYGKLEAERYECMIRYSAYFDNDKQHRKQIADQEVLYDKMSVQLVELDKHVRNLKNMVLEKDFKIFELEEYCLDLSLDHRFGIFKAYYGHEVDNNEEDDIEDDEDNEAKFEYNPYIDGDDEEEEEIVGLHKGFEMLRGNRVESFKKMPYYCHNLKKVNPGTVTNIKVDNEERFEMLFISIGVTSDFYLEVNLLAVGMDGNNQILPIAYSIFQGEDGPRWTWFLKQLKVCIREDPKLAIISDRHPGIIQAVKKVYPNAFHGCCCRHLMMDAGLNVEKIKLIYWKMYKAYTIHEFDRYLAMIQGARPNAYDKLKANGYSKWSRSYCVADHYNYLTSNSAESVNSLTQKARKLSVTMLMEFFRDLLHRWYFERKETG